MLLAIDTATQVLSLALYDGQQVYAESTWITAIRHTVELTPAIQRLLVQAQQTPANLTLLAVSQGPGSFNGLRIGFSMAKALAMALNIPLIAVPTLDIVAAAQPAFKGNLVAVAQAGRGRVCACTYRWRKPSWISMNDTQIVSWEGLLQGIARETVIAGEIDSSGRTAIQTSGKPIHIASPAVSLRRAGQLAELAWLRWQNRQPGDDHLGDPALAIPLYLHQPGVPHP